jgi:YHS domain-containing protein
LVVVACKNRPANAEKAAAIKQKVDSSMHSKKHSAIDITQLAIEKTDPFCNMPVAAGIVDTTTVDGKLYGFCDPACKEGFLKEAATKKSNK